MVKFRKTSLALLAISAVPLGLSAQDGIGATRENGRTVFVNAGEPTPVAAPADAAPAAQHLVYWSNTQHRWKPVPTPTRRQLRSARSAAAEVQALVDRAPLTPLPVSTKADSPFAEFSAPDTRGLT